MNTDVQVPDTRGTTAGAPRLIRWSWAMVPLFVLVWFVLGIVSFLSLGLFGLAEGDLVLMAHSVAAWVFFVACWLVIGAIPVAGLVLAARARVEGARLVAWSLAMAANVVVLLLVAYQVFDEIRMSYRG